MTAVSVRSSAYRVVYKFRNRRDGVQPQQLLVLHGALYGTTVAGGTSKGGTVFRLTSTGSETVLHDFQTFDGFNAPLALAFVDGSFYGTTAAGGSGHCRFTNQHTGCGLFYALRPSGTYRVIRDFGKRGLPAPNKVTVVNGRMYGTGGDYVYSLSPSGAIHVIYHFNGRIEGSLPNALTFFNDKFYGTTSAGGAHNAGTIFSLTRSGVEKTLYTFTGGNDGSTPFGALTVVGGVLYGTTYDGGTGTCYWPSGPRVSVGCGTIFSVTLSGAQHTIHAFAGGREGAFPSAGMIEVAGTLYGTTCGSPIPGIYNDGYGNVFSVSPSGAFRVLHSFQPVADLGGACSIEPLTELHGTLYGTTFSGPRFGTVFALKP